VVGINSRGQGRGIGFTIPIDTVLEVKRQIAEGGVERGWIGITLQPLSRDLAAYFGIPEASGVIVNGVSPGSPAARAKLAPGDVITHFEGKPVEAEQEEDLGDFQRRVAAVPPGRKVELKLLRDGKARDVQVELGTQPTVQPEESETGFGFHVQEITEKLFREQRLESREGAYVSFVARGSAASEAGLFPGDVVERIDDRRVRDLAELRSALEGVEAKSAFLITARRGADVKFLLVKRGVQPAAPATPGEDPGEAAHAP
jgi:serine protease Do